MSDSEALLQTVLAHPADDLPRLIFADFLEESGDPASSARAEFIRVQCELAQVEAEPDPATVHAFLALRTRERLLLSKFSDAWFEPLRRRGEPFFSALSHGHFRRGFVEIAWMPAGQFLWKAEKLFARVPLRELRLTMTTHEELAELMDSPHTAKLGALDLSDRKLGDRVAQEIARSSQLRSLRHLRLKGCGLTDAGAEILAGADLGHLTRLEVQWNHFTEAGRRALMGAFGTRVLQEW
jgi:uncharacterized protein (TIGR02996 family)